MALQGRGDGHDDEIYASFRRLSDLGGSLWSMVENGGRMSPN